MGQTLRLSAPGKTFLLGEYGALEKKPALLVNTGPRFILDVNIKGGTQPLRGGLSTSGPVIELLKDPFFTQFDLNFYDPHKGLGGFGASSAQFVLLFALMKHLKTLPILEGELIETYHQCLPQKLNILPSGYDLLSQIMGRVTYIDRYRDHVEALEWDFKDLEFVLVRTGQKVITHNHLNEIQNTDFEEFSGPVIKAHQALKAAHSELFIHSVQKFHKLLENKKLVSENTLSLIEKLKSGAGFITAKGCGALGADVILCLVDKKSLGDFANHVTALKLQIVATSQHLSNGMALEPLKTDQKDMREQSL